MSAAAAGAIIQGLGELGGNIINSAALAMNRDLAYRNYNWGKYGLLANLLMQNEQWQREDTAVQRRVKDLKAAGLSPVLAAGSAAISSPPMRIETPKNDFQMPMNLIQLNKTAESLNTFALTKSQTELMNAQKLKIDQARMLDLLSYPSRIKNLDARTSNIYNDIVRKSIENYYLKLTGVGQNSSEVGRTTADVTRILDNILRGAKGALNQENKN